MLRGFEGFEGIEGFEGFDGFEGFEGFKGFEGLRGLRGLRSLRGFRGAPQDGDPSPQAQTATDASGSGTPASERSQVKVAGVHWFSCTPSAIAKAWIRTLIVLILTVGLIVLLFIFMNQAGLIRLK